MVETVPQVDILWQEVKPPMLKIGLYLIESLAKVPHHYRQTSQTIANSIGYFP